MRTIRMDSSGLRITRESFATLFELEPRAIDINVIDALRDGWVRPDAETSTEPGGDPWKALS